MLPVRRLLSRFSYWVSKSQVALLYFMPERKREIIHLLESDFFHGVETSSLYKSKYYQFIFSSHLFFLLCVGLIV